MRRVYDDSHFEEIKAKVCDIIREIPADVVSKYDYGIYRAKVGLIREYIEARLPIRFGRNDHLHGIGNNNAIEMIVCGDNEEQICGLLHLTDDMFGTVICWVSDIDGERRSESLYVHGTDPNSSYKMMYRFAREKYWGK